MYVQLGIDRSAVRVPVTAHLLFTLYQTVWVQDIPIRQTPIAHDPKASDFPTAFERVLKALNVGPALTSFVHNDVSTTSLSALQI